MSRFAENGQKSAKVEYKKTELSFSGSSVHYLYIRTNPMKDLVEISNDKRRSCRVLRLSHRCSQPVFE
jgi:hypothetical protein